MIQVSRLKNNPNNPRKIDNDALEKLMRSISQFPEMMIKRPMVCVTDTDDKLFPLGGNMRLKAIKKLGMKEIPETWVSMADDWTEEQRRQFIIKDNASLGQWDIEDLNLNWNVDELDEWGVDVHDYEVFDGDIDDFFEDTDEKESKPKVVLCPHCGCDINDTADENGIRATKEESDGEYIKGG